MEAGCLGTWAKVPHQDAPLLAPRVHPQSCQLPLEHCHLCHCGLTQPCLEEASLFLGQAGESLGHE